MFKTNLSSLTSAPLFVSSLFYQKALKFTKSCKNEIYLQEIIKSRNPVGSVLNPSTVSAREYEIKAVEIRSIKALSEGTPFQEQFSK